MCQYFGHCLVNSAMEINRDIHLIAHSIPDSLNTLAYFIDLAIAIDVMHLFRAVHLHSCTATFPECFYTILKISGPVPSDPAIHTQFIAALTTNQVIDRSPIIFAFNIPKGLINTSNGTHNLRTTTVESCSVHGLPDILYLHRIISDEISFQLLHSSLHSRSSTFSYRLTPSCYSFISLHFQEKPSWRNNIQVDVCYFHHFLHQT